MPQSVGRKLTTSRERTVRIRKVVGSIPIRSTIFKKNHRQFGGDFSFDHNFTTDREESAPLHPALSRMIWSLFRA